jgi:hypothetical protein
VDATRYNEPVDYRLEEGKVIHIESGADAASNRVRVRVVVPNPAQVPYGLHVLVEFPPSQTATTGKATGALADQTQPKGDVNVREEERQGTRSPR